MAGGKEYTLTFLLKAAADSSYQAAFAKAKQELNQFQQQIQQNNSLLKDISAYERQEQAVQRAAEKVAEKAAALEKARAAAEAAGNADEKLNAAQLKAEAAVKNATEKLNQQEQKLKTQGDALRQAGVNTDNLAEEQTRLANSTENLKQQQEAQAEAQNRQLQAMAEMEAVAAEAYVVIQAVEQLGQAWKSCVDAASGFQYAMSATEAVSQATAAEMSELSAVAKEVGATTIYTATEIASAMEYMGLAGWSAQEMIEGIPSVANLAAASGENLSRVCDIVTDSMMALGYGTEDTARFCDVLAQTARSSNTNVTLMGDTLKYVASTAGALDYSIEDVATAMGALASSGIKSGMAGTSLRNILASLADPSDEAAAALEELNIHLADSEGNAYSLENVIAQLRSGFAGLTQEQKVQYASMIAGKRGMTGVLTLVNMTQEAYDELGATIRDCEGAAQSMAQTRLDNFQGSVIILESAFDALKTSIGEAFLDAGQSGAQILTDLTNGANNFVIKNQELVVGATAAVGAFGAMAVGVTGVTTAMKLFNLVFAGSALANPAMWVGIAGAAVIAGIITAFAQLNEETETASEATERLRGELDELQKTEFDIESYRQLQEALNDTDASAEQLDQTQAELNETVQALKEAYPEMLGDIEAGTAAWDMQTEALLKYIQQQEKLKLLEVSENMADVAEQAAAAKREVDLFTSGMADAEAQMQNIPDVDFTNVLNQINDLSESLSEDLYAGNIEVDFDDGSEWMLRIQEIQSLLQGLPDSENIELFTLNDVDEQVERLRSIPEMLSAYSEDYREASNNAAEAQQRYDGLASSMRLAAIEGAVISGALKDNGLTLSEIGVTSEYIGEQISTGVMTAEEAMARYGITAGETEWAIRAYQYSQREAATATEEQADITNLSKLTLDRYGRAIADVEAGTFDAAEAAAVWNINEEELQAILEESEDLEKRLAAASAAVENGYLDAEAAADRFGVSLEAMDAYQAQQELEALESELEELQSAYDSAYNAALSSIQGQGSLLEGLALDAERTKLTIDDALGNMREIESYWSTYTANMEALQGYGLSTDFLTRYCDTSADGVANTTDLANELSSLSTAEAQARVEELNSAFESMVSQEQTTADATADMETQYTATAANIAARMAELESSVASNMNAMVASMNKSGAAYSNGSATGAAFVSGIRSQISAARAAAAALAAAGTPSGGGGSYTGGKAHGGFTNGPELAGEDPRYPVEAVISFNPQYHDENVGYLQMAAKRLGVDVGTDSTETGRNVDWSGYTYGGLTDYGTEMLKYWSRLQTGGEEREAPIYLGSAAANEGATVNISYSPSLQVSAGTTRAEILAMLREYDEQLADKIMQVKEDMDRTERRTRLV